MTVVARAHHGAQNKNHLRVKRVKMYFQRFPGKIGTDNERAVDSNPTYAVKLNGKSVQNGQLEDDGSLELVVPGGAKVELEIFGTTYKIDLLQSMEPHDTLLGQQRRLQLLGYYEYAVDDKHGPRTDAAILDFQAANGLDPNGQLDANTVNKIKSVVGE